jgi:hypothetical protein
MYFESFLFSDQENAYFSSKEFSIEEKSKKESFEEVSSSLPSQIIELGEGVRGVRGFRSAFGGAEKPPKPPTPTPTLAEQGGFAFFLPGFGQSPYPGKKMPKADAEKQSLGGGLFPATAKQDFLLGFGQSPYPTQEKMAFATAEEKISLKREESLSFSTNFQNSLQKRLQTKIVELAKHYNEESIEAVTNFFADILSFATLWFLLVRLEIQINITKSFLLEVFFGLDDSKKSLLILFLTDLLVGYHSPNIWELFFQTFFDHYGLPESQTTIFLLVATLPVLLDVLFKYLIFRHLNRASPATVATYHAMIE